MNKIEKKEQRKERRKQRRAKIKEKIEQYKYRQKLKRLDEMYYFYGFHGLLFEPSFYLTHTKEEIEEETKKCIAEIKAIVRNIPDNKGSHQ